MSVENPVHLADIDYGDPKKVAEYLAVKKKMAAVEAAWATVETKLAALAKLSGEERVAAIAELEALRNAACEAMTTSEDAIQELLPAPETSPPE